MLLHMRKLLKSMAFVAPVAFGVLLFQNCADSKSESNAASGSEDEPSFGLHVAGILPSSSSKIDQVQKVEVKIQPGNKPMAILLMAATPTDWQIVGDSQRVLQVYLIGNRSQEVTGPLLYNVSTVEEVVEDFKCYAQGPKNEADYALLMFDVDFLLCMLRAGGHTVVASTIQYDSSTLIIGDSNGEPESYVIEKVISDLSSVDLEDIGKLYLQTIEVPDSPQLDLPKLQLEF